jgi:enoyl-CoA hydratase
VGDPPGGVYIDPSKDHKWFHKYQFLSREVYFRIFDLQKPVIAQVEGYCLAGGTHLAGFCDLRIVADDAQIGFPVGRNLTTQGFQYEVWLMGASKAKYYLLTGDPMDGKTADEWGWASKAFPADIVEAETEKLARRIALTDPSHLMMAKRSINRQLEFQGLKTAMQWSMDVHTAGGHSQGDIMNANDFWRVQSEEGVRAAVDTRDSYFGIEYDTRDGAE